MESKRNIPIHATVDVVVVGGTTAGVAAAEAAARKGASVYLVAPSFYLGEDLCGTLRLERDKQQELATDLEKALFANGTPSPKYVKGLLTKRLVDAKVRFIYASFVSDVLRDKKGNIAGVAITNRAGRQAIMAKVVIDATEHAWVARGPADCQTTPWNGGTITFEQGILLKDKKGVAKSRHEIKAFNIEIPDLSFVSLNKARDIARDRIYSLNLLRQAESLFFVPPVTVVCRKSQQDWKASKPDLDCFRPKGTERLYILNGWADVPRDAAAKLLQPGGLCAIGEAIGKAAAKQAKELSSTRQALISGKQESPAARGDVKELLRGARPIDEHEATVVCEQMSIPVLAEVDVLVIGGGTAGAPAAISAARQGVKTLVVEYHEGLGGIGTVGQIGKAYHGREAGFAKEVPYPTNIEEKMEWYRRELHKAGGEMWFRCMGAGAFVEGKKVKGAVVCTPEQRGVVLAKVVIDATGNGDVAIAAGADFMYGTIEQGDIALQGTGFSTRIPDKSYNNSDFLLVDEVDMLDVWSSLSAVYLQPFASPKEPKKGKQWEDYSTLILNREHRRVIGDTVIRYTEQVAGRTYHDTIVYSHSDYDSHGYPTGPFFYLFPHNQKSLKANHPAPGGDCYSSYRAFTPKGLEGILVGGVGISMDRDVTAMVRMQRDIANQGYALGYAASMAVKQKKSLRKIDVDALQEHLVKTGALPRKILSVKDNFPFSKEEVREAVAKFGRAKSPKGAGQPLAVIMTHRDIAMPLLEKAFANNKGKTKLLYARVLAAFGNKSVVPFLIGELNKVKEWDAKVFQGHMADHAHLPTPVDSLVLALGYAGDRQAVPAITRAIEMLRDGKGIQTLSHYRSVALAAERIGDPTLAEQLASLLLDKKGNLVISAITDLDQPEIGQRSQCVQEITLARALYRIGDCKGIGKKVLEAYRNDKRGLFARHAEAVLKKK